MVDGRLLAFLPKKKSKFRGIYQAKGCSRQIFFTNEPKKRDIPTSGGVVGTLIFRYPTRTQLFWANQNVFFQVEYVSDPTRTRPYETKHKIWSKKFMIPDRILDFLGTQIRLFGIPTRPEFDFLLSDLFDTQLFATRSTTILNPFIS